MSSAPEVTRSRVVGGVLWTVLRQVVGQGTQVLVTLALAHLLTPRDFGLAAMVLAFSGVVVLLSDFALGAALIQKRELTEEDRSTAFWTSAAGGVVFGLVAVAVAGLVADFYREPDVEPLFAVLGLAFVLEALGTTQGALLMRQMRFRSLEIRLIAATLAAAVVALVLAALGAGPWAIIVQSLTITAVSTALLWLISPWRPRLTYSPASLRAVGSFGGGVFATRLLWYANRNADKLLIGRFVGSQALGAYVIAYSVMFQPLSRLAIPIQAVFFPAFSSIRDPERIGAIWLRANRLVAAVTTPALLGTIVVAPELVSSLLGSRWHEAVPVLRILAVTGLVQSLQAFNAAILQGLGRAGTLLRSNLVITAATLAAFVAGLPWGIVGVATAYAVSSALVEPWYGSVTARAVGVPLRDLARSLAGVAQASVAMAAGVLGAQQALVHAGLPTGLRLALEVLFGITLYVPLCAWRAPEVVAEVRRISGDLLGRRGAAPVRRRRSPAAVVCAPFQARHYVALWNVPRVYARPWEGLKRYLLATGDYPYVCRVRTPIGPVDITLHNPHDMLTVNEVFCREDYRAPRDLGVAVDVGANIGVSALYFLTRNRRARCYLYEPDPRNVDKLRANLAGFEGRFVLREHAVSDADGIVDFGIETTGRYGGIGLQTGETIRVESRDVNAVLEDVLAAEAEIDVLKVDIEGHELRTVRAIRPDLLERIRVIYLESSEPVGDLHAERFSRSRRGRCERLVRRRPAPA